MWATELVVFCCKLSITQTAWFVKLPEASFLLLFTDDDSDFGLFIQLPRQKAEFEQSLVDLKHQFFIQIGMLACPVHYITYNQMILQHFLQCHDMQAKNQTMTIKKDDPS